MTNTPGYVARSSMSSRLHQVLKTNRIPHCLMSVPGRESPFRSIAVSRWRSLFSLTSCGTRRTAPESDNLIHTASSVVRSSIFAMEPHSIYNLIPHSAPSGHGGQPDQPFHPGMQLSLHLLLTFSLSRRPKCRHRRSIPPTESPPNH